MCFWCWINANAQRALRVDAAESRPEQRVTPSVSTRLQSWWSGPGIFRVQFDAFYTLLMEVRSAGPVVDAVARFWTGMLCSHGRWRCGWYPPVDVLDSLSRLMPAVTTPEHRERGGCRASAAGCSCSLGGSGAHRRLNRNRWRVGPRRCERMPLLKEFMQQGTESI